MSSSKRAVRKPSTTLIMRAMISAGTSWRRPVSDRDDTTDPSSEGRPLDDLDDVGVGADDAERAGGADAERAGGADAGRAGGVDAGRAGGVDAGRAGGVDAGRAGGADADDAIDAELVRRTRDGDLYAYEQLIRRYAPLAHRTAVLLAGADAEDALQEAFVKAYRAIGRYRGDAPFRPWLLRIVANEARNSRRSARRRADLPVRIQAAHGLSSSGEAAPSPEEEAFAQEQRRALLAAVQQLPERERRVVTCRYLLQLSEAETAAVLHLPQGTVKSRLFRALKRLRAAPVLAGQFGVAGEEVARHG